MKKVKKMFGGGMSGLPTAGIIRKAIDERRSAPGYTPSTTGLGDVPLEKIRQMQAANAPKIGTRPPGMGTTGGPKPAPGITGTRPPGILGTTGGPKPAPAVQLPTAQNPGGRGLGNIASRPTGGPKPAFGLGGAPLPFGMKGPGPIGVMGPTAGPGALKYTGPGFGPTAPFNQAKMNQINSMLQGKPMKKGGAVKASSASKRADGCAIKGKTKGKIV
jgi:hypothetical protein